MNIEQASKKVFYVYENALWFSKAILTKIQKLDKIM